METYFILGGARSGKSARAQALAETLAPARCYIATAEPFDAEMRARIARHQAERGAGWTTLDAPLALSAAIAAETAPGRVCLVDCLTLWLSNLMHYEHDVESAAARLAEAVAAARGPLILVSNEVGLGLVPETPLGRRFRDAQGRLNQRIAAICAHVEFLAAGLPLKLKG